MYDIQINVRTKSQIRHLYPAADVLPPKHIAMHTMHQSPVQIVAVATTIKSCIYLIFDTVNFSHFSKICKNQGFFFRKNNISGCKPLFQK